jgi:DNA polymerase-1
VVTEKILIIDALNLFSRHYIRNPAMSTLGHQAGGVVGFLNALKYLINIIAPTDVFVIWEGGGSLRRRAIYSDYKKNRKPPKLNRYYEKDIPDSSENRIQQIKLLVELLKNVPVRQIFINDCEADDVIGYICRNSFREKKKYIASSDRDFYQLLDENTMIYSWTTKKFIGFEDVKNEFNISPKNFALAKAICGDPSDNINGIKGVGFKTVAKHLDVKSDDEISVEELINVCIHRSDKTHKIYTQIYNNIDLIKRNMKLMYLDTNNLSSLQIRKIENSISSPKNSKNKLLLMKMLINDGLSSFDAQDFYSAFNEI